MKQSFLSVVEGTSSETEQRKSIFFCHLKMTLTVEEADAFIREMKRKYKGYTNASAYIVGHSGEHQRARDNGEPSGTAGLPILEALKKHHLVNTTAVVSREWGGQLLGANRLKIYYGGAVDKAVGELGLAEWRLQQAIQLTIPYHFSGQVENHLKEWEWVKLDDMTYTQEVLFYCHVDKDDLDRFESEVNDLTNGQADFKLGLEQYVPFPLN